MTTTPLVEEIITNTSVYSKPPLAVTPVTTHSYFAHPDTIVTMPTYSYSNSCVQPLKCPPCQPEPTMYQPCQVPAQPPCSSWYTSYETTQQPQTKKEKKSMKERLSSLAMYNKDIQQAKIEPTPQSRKTAIMSAAIGAMAGGVTGAITGAAINMALAKKAAAAAATAAANEVGEKKAAKKAARKTMAPEYYYQTLPYSSSTYTYPMNMPYRTSSLYQADSSCCPIPPPPPPPAPPVQPTPTSCAPICSYDYYAYLYPSNYQSNSLSNQYSCGSYNQCNTSYPISNQYSGGSYNQYNNAYPMSNQYSYGRSYPSTNQYNYGNTYGYYPKKAGIRAGFRPRMMNALNNSALNLELLW